MKINYTLKESLILSSEMLKDKTTAQRLQLIADFYIKGNLVDPQFFVTQKPKEVCRCLNHAIKQFCDDEPNKRNLNIVSQLIRLQKAIL